ncbi:hypothetical protein IAQ61_001658 [Plenodomus lingam]|uniref:Leucine Rich Repeat domain protein n=1 Tax=Leptosphaeria maculans (strain JN3 / isolate v23.1.3 / race Av1-4-5-6-7-8) TaxID=985895 RepID=M1ZIN2_LEPMJ|nr:hypothetical protein IAQ61_001658 [Plenodomus lingam]CCT61102.1 hypothetical protein [Plenodomus lingam JN3]
MDIDAVPPSSPPVHASTSHVDSSPFFESRSRTYSLKSSSPPPLFSSDDSRESVDVTNYQSPRIFKNKRKGAWWDNSESAQNTPEPKKSRMTRNFDSGVYMMSDATDSSEDPLPLHTSPFPSGFDNIGDERHGLLLPQLNPRALQFNDTLQSGLDMNSEIYEFRGFDLEDEDIKDVGRIASVIKNVPDPGDEFPEEGQFRSLEPEIYINLADNKLRRLSPKLFQIQHLTTLIIRFNNIEELPQGMNQLKNLKTLDVSCNKLRSLPFELLALLKPFGSLERVHTMSNPVLEPMTTARFLEYPPLESPDVALHSDVVKPLNYDRAEASEKLPILYDGLAASSDLEREVWRIRYLESWADPFGAHDDARKNADKENMCSYRHHPSLPLNQVSPLTPRFMARTPVSYFDHTGSLIQGSPSPPITGKPLSVIVQTNRGAYGVPSSFFEPPSKPAVPPLSAMALHSVLKARHFDNQTVEDIHDMLIDPTAEIPRSIEALFARAIDNNRGGWGEFRECHLCSKEYVVPRAEWVEFWSAGPALFHPFQVKVCSWACVPAGMARRPEELLTW